jgi:hypothetical protein
MLDLSLSPVLRSLLLLLASSLATEPEQLNQLRLRTPASSFHGEFSLIMQAEVSSASSSSSTATVATPSDVKGPFHLPPENVPDGFPRRNTSCVAKPSCKTGGMCKTSVYDGGLPLILKITVTSTQSQAQSGQRLLPGAFVDIWQADPNGVYWKDDDHWGGRRRLDNEAHRFNCRAHGVADAQGVVSFSTYLPGHYVAGSAW